MEENFTLRSIIKECKFHNKQSSESMTLKETKNERCIHI